MQLLGSSLESPENCTSWPASRPIKSLLMIQFNVQFTSILRFEL